MSPPSEMLLSVVVSTLAFSPEFAGSNPVSAKLWSLFNFLAIFYKKVKKF